MTATGVVVNNQRGYWSPEQLALLRLLWGLYPSKVIAQYVNKTGNAVIGKAHRLGLPQIDPETRARWIAECRDYDAEPEHIQLTDLMQEPSHVR